MTTLKSDATTHRIDTHRISRTRAHVVTQSHDFIPAFFVMDGRLQTLHKGHLQLVQKIVEPHGHYFQWTIEPFPVASCVARVEIFASTAEARRSPHRIATMNSASSLIACASILSACAAAHAEIVTYAFTGITNVGSQSSTFSGTVVIDDSLPSSSVYYNGTGPTQGFATRYNGAVLSIDMHVDEVQQAFAGAGYLQCNNIIQAEPGGGLPQGLSMQAYGGAAFGNIHGQSITFLYLAFIPVQSSFNWDAIDALYGGNAENMLNDNPSLLSPTIDPSIIDTEIPADPNAKYINGLFLGTVYPTSQGAVTSLNTITSFARVTQPQCAADLDDGSGTGNTDGGVDINDLLYFLARFEEGATAADLDNGSNSGTPDGGVDINDLLFFLSHFEAGC